MIDVFPEPDDEYDEYGEDDFDDDFADDFEDDPDLAKLDMDIKLTAHAQHFQPKQKASPNTIPNPLTKRGTQQGGKQSVRDSSEWLVERRYVSKQRFTPLEKKQMERERKRVQNILKDVDLSFEKFDLINMEPEDPLKGHMRGLALGRIREVATQYNDDWRSIAVQTEAPKTHSIATQHPDFKGSTLTDSATARLPEFVFRASQLIEKLIMEQNRGTGFWTIPKMEISTPDTSRNPLTKESFSLTLPKVLARRRIIDIHFSESDPHVLLAAYSKEIESEIGHLNNNARNLLRLERAESGASGGSSRPSSSRGPRLHSLSPQEWEEEVLPQKAILCLWHVNQPESPVSLMYCEGEPSCCGLSLDGAHIAFAGTKEGSLLLWDLREKPVLHRKGAPGGQLQEYVLRHPSFSTDRLLEQNHPFAVQKVVALPSRGAAYAQDKSGTRPVKGHTREQRKSGRTGFQVASMDEGGNTIIWTVVELAKGNIAGSELDFGLHLGARVKLIKSNDLIVNKRLRDHGAVDLACNPSDPQELLIALRSGCVTRCRRFGNQPSPAHYFLLGEGALEEELETKQHSTDWGFSWELQGAREEKDVRASFTRLLTQGGTLRSPKKRVNMGLQMLERAPACALKDSCVCIAISPFLNNYFLAGYASGQLALFRIALSRPVTVWNISTVKIIKWSCSRPAVFYVLDTAGNLHCFDLLVDDQAPISSVKLEGATRKAGITSLMQLSSIDKVMLFNKDSNRMSRPTLVYSDVTTTTITIRGLTSLYSIPREEEIKKFQNFVSRLV